MGIALATGREPSLMFIRMYFNVLSAEVQALFFSLWQVAHELERRESLARVFEFEPLPYTHFLSLMEMRMTKSLE